MRDAQRAVKSANHYGLGAMAEPSATIEIWLSAEKLRQWFRTYMGLDAARLPDQDAIEDALKNYIQAKLSNWEAYWPFVKKLTFDDTNYVDHVVIVRLTGSGDAFLALSQLLNGELSMARLRQEKLELDRRESENVHRAQRMELVKICAWIAGIGVIILFVWYLIGGAPP